MKGGAPMDDNKRTPDDSYKDLLDIYAREEDEQKRPELKNMVERNRKSDKKPFKLEIKDLDSEFTDAPQKTACQTRYARASQYRCAGKT